MNYTGRQILMSAREREDGFWRVAVWMRDDRPTADGTAPPQHAWKVKPLSFASDDWQMLAMLQEAVRYVKDVNDQALDPEDPDQLDLWGDV